MDEWATPQAFFDLLDREFHFDLDPCATDLNHKCERYFTKEQDGLNQRWDCRAAFINPPYGKHGCDIEKWVTKAIFAEDCIRVMLLPVRADTEWWQYICCASEVRFMRNRLYFTDPTGRVLRAPFATCLWVFLPDNGNLTRVRVFDCGVEFRR